MPAAPGKPIFVRAPRYIILKTPPYCGLGVVVGEGAVVVGEGAVVVGDGAVVVGFGAVDVGDGAIVVVADGTCVVGVVLAQAGKNNTSRRIAKNP